MNSRGRNQGGFRVLEEQAKRLKKAEMPRKAVPKKIMEEPVELKFIPMKASESKRYNPLEEYSTQQENHAIFYVVNTETGEEIFRPMYEGGLLDLKFKNGDKLTLNAYDIIAGYSFGFVGSSVSATLTHADGKKESVSGFLVDDGTILEFGESNSGMSQIQIAFKGVMTNVSQKKQMRPIVGIYGPNYSVLGVAVLPLMNPVKMTGSDGYMTVRALRTFGTSQYSTKMAELLIQTKTPEGVKQKKVYVDIGGTVELLSGQKLVLADLTVPMEANDYSAAFNVFDANGVLVKSIKVNSEKQENVSVAGTKYPINVKWVAPGYSFGFMGASVTIGNISGIIKIGEKMEMPDGTSFKLEDLTPK